MNGTELTNSHFVFREVASDVELDSLVRLLCQVYRECGQVRLCPEVDGRIRYDKYDEVSTHFGLFRHSNGTEIPIGYLRVVHGDRFPESERDPLPMLKYFPDADVVRSACNRYRHANLTFTETGRMGVLKEYRSMEFIRFIVDAVASWGFLIANVDYALTCAWPALQRIYRRVNFRRLDGTRAHRILELDISAVCLVTTFDQVPSNRRKILELMAYAFRKTGRICFNPSNPGCFYAPCEHQQRTQAPDTAVA